MIIHVFGAVFGLIAGRVLFTKTWRDSEHLGSVYHSDIFTFVGKWITGMGRVTRNPIRRKF